MLIEFTVSNYRSISEPVTFSAVASAAATKQPGITFETGNSLAPHVLTSAVVFGPNASGKSSLFKAVEFFVRFVCTSAKKGSQGEEIKFPQNKVAPDCKDAATTMEMVFSHDGEVFQYGFSLTNERVVDEWLFARTSKHGSKTRTIFTREYVEASESYEWVLNEGQLPGERESWRAATRDNALFFSTAVQLNSKSLKKPYDWIRMGIHVIGANQRISKDFTAQFLQDEKYRDRVVDFIQALDLPIVGFRVEEKQAVIPENAKQILSEKMLSELAKSVEDEKDYRVFAKHKNAAGDTVELALEEESDGTQAMFGMAGPIIDVLEDGDTLLIDELSNSLHPLALKGLVGVFHDKRQNPKGAQLIFSSHETSIISKSFMHKDQIWFIHRPDAQNTELTPLSDFKVREVEAFQRAYLGGKFGAIPNIRRMQNAGAE
ncbi:ATP/GTP-binding protein [Cognatishimia sp. WU-CL00825]|uniref:AAA family ATPase n=1 Tax=Cognatishimia sp. WU-CL00825 TaxID=3127658 RepID=UPI003106B908